MKEGVMSCALVGLREVGKDGENMKRKLGKEHN